MRVFPVWKQVCVCVCVGDNPLHEGLFALRAIPSVVQGLEVWVAWLHHRQLLFLSFPSLAITPSLPSLLSSSSLSLRSLAISPPSSWLLFSPSTSLNHPLFCPFCYIRHWDQCTDDLSLQIFLTVPLCSFFFCSFFLANKTEDNRRIGKTKKVKEIEI